MRISDWSSDVCSSDLRSSWMGLPVTRSELLLPILKIISDKGKAAPRELYDEIGDLFGLDQSVRDEVANYNGRPSRLYDRTIRWAMQDCKRQGWRSEEHTSELSH